jgi:hypothetical protein
MTARTELIWQALGFRTSALLQAVDGLTEAQLSWSPPNGANSVAWLLWHIAEVEDNWVRDKLYREPPRYPFGSSVRETNPGAYPGKSALVSYFHEVRSLSRERLERTVDADLDRAVEDDHFGELTVGQVWMGVATSCAWHGGQIVMLANRFVPR